MWKILSLVTVLICLLVSNTSLAFQATFTEAWANAAMKAVYEDLAPEIIYKVKMTLADSLGAMVYSGEQDEVRRYLKAAATGGREEATELVSGRKVPLLHAAAINAFCIHGHEIDDSNLRNQLRASCVAIPAPLAMAEHFDATGKELILALAISYDISDRLASAMNLVPELRLHRRGFMPSSVCGVIGATAACAKIGGLQEDEFVSALGLASSGANGLFQYYFDGSDEKKIHVARSQHMAIESVVLAEAGFHGARRILEGEAGLFSALGMDVSNEPLLDSLGTWGGIKHVKPKFYSCSQSVILWFEALEPIVQDNQIDVSQIDSIILRTAWEPDSFYPKKINQNRFPRSVLDAQLSPNFGIALFLLKGNAFVDQYSETIISNPEVLALSSKVKAQYDPKATEIDYISLHFKDGRSLTGEYPHSRTRSPYLPVQADYRKKFNRLTARLSNSNRERLWNHALNLDKSQSVKRWCKDLVALMELPAASASKNQQ